MYPMVPQKQIIAQPCTNLEEENQIEYVKKEQCFINRWPRPRVHCRSLTPSPRSIQAALHF